MPDRFLCDLNEHLQGLSSAWLGVVGEGARLWHAAPRSEKVVGTPSERIDRWRSTSAETLRFVRQESIAIKPAIASAVIDFLRNEGSPVNLASPEGCLGQLLGTLVCRYLAPERTDPLPAVEFSEASVPSTPMSASTRRRFQDAVEAGLAMGSLKPGLGDRVLTAVAAARHKGAVRDQPQARPTHVGRVPEDWLLRETEAAVARLAEMFATDRDWRLASSTRPPVSMPEDALEVALEAGESWSGLSLSREIRIVRPNPLTSLIASDAMYVNGRGLGLECDLVFLGSVDDRPPASAVEHASLIRRLAHEAAPGHALQMQEAFIGPFSLVHELTRSIEGLEAWAIHAESAIVGIERIEPFGATTHLINRLRRIGGALLTQAPMRRDRWVDVLAALPSDLGEAIDGSAWRSRGWRTVRSMRGLEQLESILEQDPQGAGGALRIGPFPPNTIPSLSTL